SSLLSCIIPLSINKRVFDDTVSRESLNSKKKVSILLQMDLLSMLNEDDSKPAGSGVTDRPPPSTTILTPSTSTWKDAPLRNPNDKEDSSIPQKRPRLEEEPPPQTPSSATTAKPPPQQQARDIPPSSAIINPPPQQV